MIDTFKREHRSDPMRFLEDLAAHGVDRFGDIMADFQRERFAALIPAFVAVSRGEKPQTGRFWWEATKGAAKDSDLASLLMWLVAFSKRSLTCQVGAGDFDQADEFWKAGRPIWLKNPVLKQLLSYQGGRIVNKKSGSVVDIIAADNMGSHGARPDVLILNELTHIPEGKKEFAETLMDNATKVPNGIVIIATNSGVLGTWQEEWRKIAMKGRWYFHKYDKPAPWLTAEELEEAALRNPRGRFRRLWGGEWIPDAGDALPSEDILACVKAELGPMRGNEPGWMFIGGIDAGVRADSSALAVLAANRQTQKVRLAYCRAWAPGPGGLVDLDEVEKEIIAVHRRFNLNRLWVDPAQMELMSQRLAKVGVPVKEQWFTGRAMVEMATSLLSAFRSRRVELYDDPLVAEIMKLSIEEASYGFRIVAPRVKGSHCDRATAFILALGEALKISGSQSCAPSRVSSNDHRSNAYSHGVQISSGFGDGHYRGIPGVAHPDPFWRR